MKLRPSLLATIAALCIAAGAVRAQYVEDSIDVGGAWVGSLVYNSREDVIYGESESQGLLFAISCDNNRIIATHQLMGALELVCDSTDNKSWCSYDGPEQESLAVIDGTTHSIVKRIEMPGATIPVWDAVSDRVYVSCQKTNSVAVLDAKSDSILTYIPVGARPMKMYINTLRRKLYVLNYDAGTVSVVDMATNTVTSTVSVGVNVNTGWYCRSVDKYYCGGMYRRIAVLDGKADSVVATIMLPVGAGALSLTGSDQNALVYAGFYTGTADSLYTICAGTDSVSAAVAVNYAPQGIYWSPATDLVYVACGNDCYVDVVAGDGHVVEKTLTVAWAPFVFAPVARHNRIYVGHLNSRKVYAIRDAVSGAAEPQLRPPSSVPLVSALPNPFTQSVAVAWNSPIKEGHAARVYAQDGRLVRQARIPAGVSRWAWDGRDDSGAPLPPGVYVVEAGPGVRAKVVKLK